MKILLAGSGCFLGKCLLVAELNSTQIIQEVEDGTGININEELNVLFSKLDVKHDDVIEMNLNPSFNEFAKKLKDSGYVNVVRQKASPEDTISAHKVFESSLHKLGVSEDIVLKEQKYDDFNHELKLEVASKPHLEAHIKESFKKSKNYTDFLEEVETARNNCLLLLK